MNSRASQSEPVACSIEDNSATRREFLTRIRGAAAVTLTSAAVTSGSPAKADQGPPGGADGGGAARVLDSYQNRVEAALEESQLPVPRQITNGDEQRYPNFIGNFSKGLPHTGIGEVDARAYRLFLKAVGQGTWQAFENVPLGGNTKLVNPLAGVAFDLEGTDSHQLAIPAFPKLASPELADLAVELYWMALCRGVNFTDYESNELTVAAAAELSRLHGFFGPRSKDHRVTSQTLFRGFTADDVVGPYVSQFLLHPFDYGPYHIDGKMRVYVSSSVVGDYLTDQTLWLACRNGNPSGNNTFDSQPRFARNGRDLASYVHTDPVSGLFMSFYNAGMFLYESNAPLNSGNPYLKYKTQDPFGTFGRPFFLSMIGEATARAFKAAWYAKWFVHRALRPEDFGGLVHMTLTGQKKPTGYLLDRDILNSPVLGRVRDIYGTFLLPQAYPEGSPQHPSYPSGHATMAGACATILKAAFKNAPFSTLTDNIVVTASDDGLELVPVDPAPKLTVYGEINKLASNIAQGRDFAGIHWRSDADWGMRLGEAVAISLLRDQRNNYPGEDFDGFTFTKFDGTPITV